VRFHRALYDHSGSRILAEALEPFIRRSVLGVLSTVGFHRARVGVVFSEHRAILEALAKRHEHEAVPRLRDHLQTAMKFSLAARGLTPFTAHHS
jgi:DNA-binding GntR family transcriptional regulator